MADATPVVGIIMGSESDMPAMEPCMAQLDAMGVPVRGEGGERPPQTGRGARVGGNGP